MKHNFYAGPAILPQVVLKQARESITNFADMGLSLLEISHRSAEFTAVMEEAESLTKELLGLDDRFRVLFLTGGASSQFYMTAMNFLGSEDTAGYIDTGTWSTKAIKEAKQFGNLEIVGSSAADKFTSIPRDLSISSKLKYLHVTSNNTIYGTQFQSYPEIDAPLVCDMSSDIFSRPIDPEKYGMIYAGAQKNLGPAGTTLVIIRDDMMNMQVDRPIPTMLDYKTHIAKNSMFNTPPVFPIYVSLLTMRWIKDNGGLTEMEKRNEAKAKLLYDEIDRNPLFVGTVAVEDRSKMNVTFLLHDSNLEAKFLEEAAAHNCVGLKGHRSVGGFRASIYNAIPIESVAVLVDCMKKFASKHA